MAQQDENVQNESVEQYIASLDDEQTAKDARVLAGVMRRISGEAPKLWNVGTLGFGEYHYKYDTGREGDNFILGFYPRKGTTTIYLMDGTARYGDLLSKLGKHMIKGYCIIFKRLNDINLPGLEQILQQSYDHITALAKEGPIDRILWKTEKQVLPVCFRQIQRNVDYAGRKPVGENVIQLSSYTTGQRVY